MYIYPSNLREKAKLGVWALKDVVIILVLALVSFFIFAQSQYMWPLVLTATYMVLSATVEDISIKDYLKYLIRFIITECQVYKWGLG